MSDIFLSYKSEDRPRAKIIAEALEQHGYSVWWDRIIPPGKTFDEVIKAALDAAKCVIVLWSRESVFSDWVKEEASEGARRHILIPVLIDNVEIPLGFKRIQTANLVDWQGTLPNSEFNLLLNSIGEILGKLPVMKMEVKKTSIDELSMSARQLYEEGKYPEAINAWKEVLNLDPENRTAIEGMRNTRHRWDEGEHKERERKEKEERERLSKRISTFVISPLPSELKAGETKEEPSYKRFYKRFLIVIAVMLIAGSYKKFLIGIVVAGMLIAGYWILAPGSTDVTLKSTPSPTPHVTTTILQTPAVTPIETTPVRLKVIDEVFEGDISAANKAGLENFENGYYYLVDWQGDKYVALKGNTNKLAKLILEQRKVFRNDGTSYIEKKTLTVGETWDVGDGWTLTAQSIDAKASPRQVWLVLSKDGVEKDDKVISQGQVYTYTEKSIAGESDVHLFVTYVDGVFAGATSDMVQLIYTWAVNTNIIQT